VDAEKKRKGRKGRKGREGRKKRKQNKVWLHFLRHAFIGTLDKNELKKFSE
jgi:endopolyphosphatase